MAEVPAIIAVCLKIAGICLDLKDKIDDLQDAPIQILSLSRNLVAFSSVIDNFKKLLEDEELRVGMLNSSVWSAGIVEVVENCESMGMRLQKLTKSLDPNRRFWQTLKWQWLRPKIKSLERDLDEKRKVINIAIGMATFINTYDTNATIEVMMADFEQFKTTLEARIDEILVQQSLPVAEPHTADDREAAVRQDHDFAIRRFLSVSSRSFLNNGNIPEDRSMQVSSLGGSGTMDNHMGAAALRRRSALSPASLRNIGSRRNLDAIVEELEKDCTRVTVNGPGNKSKVLRVQPSWTVERIKAALHLSVREIRDDLVILAFRGTAFPNGYTLKDMGVPHDGVIFCHRRGAIKSLSLNLNRALEVVRGTAMLSVAIWGTAYYVAPAVGGPVTAVLVGLVGGYGLGRYLKN